MENKIFTKDNLLVGYVVKLRNGTFRMIMPTAHRGRVVTDMDGQYSRVDDQYWSDLTHKSVHECDIMEVYGFSTYEYKAVKCDAQDRNLLWKREEKTCDNCAHKVVCTHVGTCEHYMAKN